MSPDLAEEEILAEIEESRQLRDALSEFSSDELFIRIAIINKILWMRSKTGEK